MFSTWKRGVGKQNQTAETPEIALLRETLAYLQGRASADKADESEPRVAPEDADEALTTAQRFIAEQRTIAEALLREVCTLEQRLEVQAKAAAAARAFAGAQEKAEEAARLARQAGEDAASAAAFHHAATTARKNANDLVATSRADAQTANVAVTELEGLLQNARRMAVEVAAALEQREALAQDAVAAERAAESEAAYATQRVAELQTSRARAEQEAQIARDRAEALKNEALAAAPSLAGIGDVQILAKRIAEAAAALTPESPAGWN